MHPMVYCRMVVRLSALALPTLTGTILPQAPASAQPVMSEKVACERVKTTVSKEGRFPQSVIAFCDIIVPERQSNGYVVLGLHSKRDDCGNYICSTLMGWFAVRKADGRVYRWDIEEDRPGAPVSAK